MEIIENDLGSIDEILKSGNIKVITKYLIENIYVNGAAFTGREVLEKLGRSNLSVVPLVNYFYKNMEIRITNKILFVRFLYGILLK